MSGSGNVTAFGNTASVAVANILAVGYTGCSSHGFPFTVIMTERLDFFSNVLLTNNTGACLGACLCASCGRGYGRRTVSMICERKLSFLNLLTFRTLITCRALLGACGGGYRIEKNVVVGIVRTLVSSNLNFFTNRAFEVINTVQKDSVTELVRKLRNITGYEGTAILTLEVVSVITLISVEDIAKELY
jgi:hypothetical protein